MPRRTRQQLLIENEDLARHNREELYRRLGRSLQCEWRRALTSDPLEEIKNHLAPENMPELVIPPRALRRQRNLRRIVRANAAHHGRT